VRGAINYVNRALDNGEASIALSAAVPGLVTDNDESSSINA
jgi:hypothetical protein